MGKQVYLLSYIDILYKECIVLDEKTVHNQHKLRQEWMFFFLMSIFRLYPGIKISFGNNSVRKNIFLSACFCGDSRLSLRQMDQKFKFGGIIGYGNSYLEFLFRHFQVFRLHAKLHDNAGAVRAHSGKGPGYCYAIGRRPNLCLLGHVTGLFLCLYLKIFQPSIFNCFVF